MISMGLMGIGLLLSIALVLALAITLRRQGLASESAIDYASTVRDEEYEHYEEAEEGMPEDVPPPPPMMPPLPPEGLPPGWTMEQWHYYGAEYLSRRQ
jgi:hypothetical protein